MKTACPATMCPLFAATGSPWTGEFNAPCDMGPPCGFWQHGHCIGCTGSAEQVHDVANGCMPLQLRPTPKTETAARTFDCPKAHTCQWQVESLPGLCPPRQALSQGIDPRVCAY